MAIERAASRNRQILEVLFVALMGVAVTAYAATTGSAVLTVGFAAIFLGITGFGLYRGRRPKHGDLTA